MESILQGRPIGESCFSLLIHAQQHHKPAIGKILERLSPAGRTQILFEAQQYHREYKEEKEFWYSMEQFEVFNGGSEDWYSGESAHWYNVEVVAQVTQRLQEAGATSVSSSPLMDAIAQRDRATLQQLLRDGANTRWELVKASMRGHTDVVRVLLATGVDIHTSGDDALCAASLHCHTEVVSLLLAAGADVHAKGNCALRWASLCGHNDVVSRLLASGADVHALEGDALIKAIFAGRTDTISLLLTAGADVHAQEDMALSIASSHGNLGVVQLLLEAGADVHAHYNDALVQASLRGHMDIVQTLLVRVSWPMRCWWIWCWWSWRTVSKARRCWWLLCALLQARR